jgi:hypothetical protein
MVGAVVYVGGRYGAGGGAGVLDTNHIPSRPIAMAKELMEIPSTEPQDRIGASIFMRGVLF